MKSKKYEFKTIKSCANKNLPVTFRKKITPDTSEINDWNNTFQIFISEV